MSGTGLLIILAMVGGIVALSAFIGAMTTFALDHLGAYGQILGKFRWNKALECIDKIEVESMIGTGTSIKKQLNQERIDIERDFIRIPMDLNVSSERASQLYWKLANYDKGFMLWLCPVCFGTRIILGYSIIFTVLAVIAWPLSIGAVISVSILSPIWSIFVGVWAISKIYK